MKKTYSKPEIMFESFVMSTNIAACDIKFEGHNEGICPIVSGTGETKLFSMSVAGTLCNTDGSGFDGNGFCYDVPTENNQLFAS